MRLRSGFSSKISVWQKVSCHFSQWSHDFGHEFTFGMVISGIFGYCRVINEVLFEILPSAVLGWTSAQLAGLSRAFECPTGFHDSQV